MSHIVEIKTEVKDITAIRLACQRLEIDQPQEGTYKLFSGEASGLGVRLPGWRYPVVCDITSGQVSYDNFEGRWGQQEDLDRLMQLYAVEKTKLEGRRQGHSVTEQTLGDGSIKLTLHLGANS